MEYILSLFKSLCSFPKKTIECHVISSNKSTNRSLVLAKKGERYWKTEWYNDNQVVYKVPSVNLNTIFVNKSN